MFTLSINEIENLHPYLTATPKTLLLFTFFFKILKSTLKYRSRKLFIPCSANVCIIQWFELKAGNSMAAQWCRS